jgi:transglutaminase-like putative cysteine protease
VRHEQVLALGVALLCAVALSLSAGMLAVVSPQPADVSPTDTEEPAGTDGVFDPTRVGDTPGHGHFAADGPPNELLYTVHAEDEHYYRVNTFAEYTGHGWAESMGPAPPTDPPVEDDELDPRAVTHHVRVHDRTRAAPSIRRPVRVSDSGHVSNRIREEGTLEVIGTLDEGDDYHVSSELVRPYPGEVRDRNGPFPEETARYTALPEDVPDRVERRTDAIVTAAEADSPYEKAAAVERWLEEHRNFSLERTPGDDPADALLFEQSGGYSEQFATAMAVMLRTQDVPTRYVVGYTPGGGHVEDDDHRIYAANAHAWVEVYVPETGWVRFDPTPVVPRLTMERTAVLDARTTDADARRFQGDPYRPPLYLGSPADRAGLAPKFEIQLNETPIPGDKITVTVTSDAGTPVRGAGVVFNGRSVGRTAADGTVTATVPYSDELSVQVEPPALVDEDDGDVDADTALHQRVAGVAGLAAPAVLGPAGEVATGAGSVPSTPASETDGADEREKTDEDGDTRTSRERRSDADDRREPYDGATTFELDTAVDVDLSGTAREGQQAVVTADIDGVPVRNGDVYVDGEQVGRTDQDGRATVRLPHDEDAVVRVQRGPVEGTAIHELAPWLNVTVEGLALPGQPATIETSRYGQPVDARVSLDGEVVGRTGPDGDLEVRVPVANGATLTATAGDASGTHVMGPLYVWFVPPILLAVVGSALAAWRFRASLAAAAEASGLAGALVALASGFRRAVVSVGTTFAAVVTFAGVFAADTVTWFGASAEHALTWIGRRAGGAVERVAAGVVAGAGWLVDRVAPFLGRLRTRVRAGDVVGVARLLARSPVLAASGVVAGAGLLWAWLTEGGDEATTGTDTAATAAASTAGTDADDEAGSPAPPGLFAVWRAFVAVVPATAVPSRTPGELARAAVDAGFPADPVRELTERFREVRYGGGDPDEAAGPARRAFGAIRRALPGAGATGPTAEEDGGDGA